MRQPSATDDESECIFSTKMKSKPEDTLCLSNESSEGLVKFLTAILMR